MATDEETVKDNDKANDVNNEEIGVDKIWLRAIVSDKVEKPHTW
ncbi:unnamed protein product, partial [marine sediment metagenome]